MDAPKGLQSVENLAVRRNLVLSSPHLSKFDAFIFQNNPVPLVISSTDTENPIVYEVNAAFSELVGFTRDELIGQSITQLGIAIPNEARDERIAILETQTRYRMREAQIRARDGRVISVLLSAQRSVYDGVPCDVETLIDLTQLRRTEAALHRSEAHRMAILEHVREVITQTDVKGIIQYISPASLDLLGYTSDEMLGRSGLEFVHPDDRAKVQSIMRAVFLTHMPAHRGLAEFRLLRADGQVVWVEVSGKPLRGSSGRVEHVITVFRDISERKQIESLRHEQEHLQIALQKEIELNELKARMMGRISHEFRTPLASILTSATMIERYGSRLSDEERSRKLQQIYTEIHHLTQLLDTVNLIVTRNSNLMIADRMEIDFDQLCREQIDQMQLQETQRGFTGENAHKFIYVPNAAFKSTCADPQLIRSMLQQLLGNAARYSQRGTRIWLIIDSHRRDDEEYIMIRVTDEGIGITPEDLPHIFEPFFRGRMIEESSGIGVGLNLVKDAVHAHNGAISVESEPNVGTTFTILLPHVPSPCP